MGMWFLEHIQKNQVMREKAALATRDSLVIDSLKDQCNTGKWYEAAFDQNMDEKEAKR